MLTLSSSNRYLKNSVGQFFFKTTAAKEVANNSFFRNNTYHIQRVSHNGVNVQKNMQQFKCLKSYIC